MRQQCIAAIVGMALLVSVPGWAADRPHTDADPEVIRMQEQQVVGQRDSAEQPFLPDVRGTNIYSGKKTTVIDPQEPPKIVNDNYRQALSRSPGLFLSEESTPLVSIGYRGLDPHRSQFSMVLKDGIPIAADLFGYPEYYYLPPLDAIEQIDFIRGGASLLYGPQIGGALNYVTRKPNPDRPFSLYSNHTWGSDSFYSTYNEASGTVDRFGYQVYYYQKQGLGFRESNSDFGLYSGSAKVTYALNETNRLQLAFDGYNEDHGEPGGITRDALYSNRNQATRQFDHLNLERYVGSAIWESDLTPDTLLRVATWGGRYTRFSRRQRGGGFGSAPDPSKCTSMMSCDANTNSIENQRFNTFGIDARVRHDWQALDEIHTLTAGAEYYFGDSPRTDKRGTSPDAHDGPIRNESTRTTHYGAAFAENRFTYGKFSLIPAVRLETYSLAVDESVNVSKQTAANPVALSDESDITFVPLGGVGLVYAFIPSVETYANVSGSYRPAVFSQAVTTATNQIVDGDLSPSRAWQYEIGLRGRPTTWAYWDTSLFWLQIEDQIGTESVTNVQGVNSKITNVGSARHRGWELAGEIALLSMSDSFTGTHLATQYGDLSVYANLMLLDAEFTKGPNDGKAPAYAAGTQARAGVQYTYPKLAKASLQTTFVDNAYATDDNASQFFVPHYNVWDLTVEGNIYRDVVALYAGVNNLLNENYFARVRSDGIDPAYRRNYYGGVRFNF